MSDVLILLATYNGASYLHEQLESLIAQDTSNFTIAISDDCSDDKTWSIIKKYKSTYPNISHIYRHEKNIGHAKNFHYLLRHALQTKKSYFMLCDQDDVWLPNKIGKSLFHLKKLEQASQTRSPALVHSDLFLTNAELEITCTSYLKNQKLKHIEEKAFQYLTAQNFITGCTIAFNRHLLEKSLPMPASTTAHDWWLALVCSYTGNINYISDPTIFYRQHSKNSIGATSNNGAELLRLKARKLQHTAQKVVLQAADLKAHLIKKQHPLNPQLSNFVQAFEYGTPRRLLLLIKSRIRRQSMLETLFLYLTFLTFKKPQA